MSKSSAKDDFKEMQNKFSKLKSNSEQGAGSNKAPTPQLVFKQAKDLSKDEVYEICKAHGDVITVRECTKSGFKFVELASEAEMVAMHKKLKTTHYNLNVCIDIRFKKLNSSAFPANRNDKETKNRTPRMSGKNLPPSNVQEREHSGYRRTDSDEAVIVPSSESYKEIPEGTKNCTKNTEQYKAADQMSGTYSDSKEIQSLDFGKCAQCDHACNTICDRCSTYYCGRKCQREAWPEHRRVCGTPKSVARAVNNVKENDHAEHLKPGHRNASSATNNFEENNPAKDAKSEAFAASRAANNYKTNDSLENTKNEDRNTSQATKNYKENGHVAATKNNASWSAKNYKDNGSEGGKSEDRSTSWAAGSAINEKWNDSWGAKNYKGNGLERGKTEDRSTSWAANNHKADGRAAAAKNKERNGLSLANNYKTNGSKIDVKGDVFNTSSNCFDVLKERPQKANVPIELKMPLSGSIVKITSISKVNVVFIRSKSYEAEVDFIKLLSNLDELARKKNLRHLEEPPKCGQMVIVRFKEQYSRALILGTDDLQYIKVIYFDYGIVDHINIRDMYDCPQNLVLQPRFSTPVILKNVSDCLMTKKIRSFMDSYVDNISMILKYSEHELVKEKGAYLVELIDERTNQNFNKLISNICQHEVSDNACKDLKHDYLPAGDNVKLVVMDNSSLNMGCISCTTLDLAFEIEKFQKTLQIYGDKLPGRAYTPSIGELCIAKFCMDGQWYRGRCLKVDGNGCFKIIFIDYGNVTTVDKNDIRRYPEQFKDPIYTSTCKIKGLPETCDKQMVEVLEQLIPANTIIQCDNVEVHEEKKRTYNVITLSSVLKKLQHDRLIN